ncbi:MAG: type II restriction endonuclease, partial [Terriglobales bacterium]
RQAARVAFSDVLVPIVGERATAGEFASVLADNFQSIDKFFLSLGQSRHPHLVKTFELLVCKLIACAYAEVAKPVLRGQPDFLMPSVEHFRRTPGDCLVFSVKKNLRDRWRQMVSDTARPQGYYIATLDEEVSKPELFDMEAAGFHLVVTTRLKHSRHEYQMASNVLDFETFCAQHADPAVARWRAAGIVSPARTAELRGGSTPESLPPGFGPATRPGRRITQGLNQPSLFE